jgi:hypothetical protein
MPGAQGLSRPQHRSDDFGDAPPEEVARFRLEAGGAGRQRRGEPQRVPNGTRRSRILCQRTTGTPTLLRLEAQGTRQIS